MIFNNFFLIDFDDESQPRPKYIFSKCGTNIYFFTLQRFGPSPSPNFKLKRNVDSPTNNSPPPESRMTMQVKFSNLFKHPVYGAHY